MRQTRTRLLCLLRSLLWLATRWVIPSISTPLYSVIPKSTARLSKSKLKKRALCHKCGKQFKAECLELCPKYRILMEIHLSRWPRPFMVPASMQDSIVMENAKTCTKTAVRIELTKKALRRISTNPFLRWIHLCQKENSSSKRSQSGWENR